MNSNKYIFAVILIASVLISLGCFIPLSHPPIWQRVFFIGIGLFFAIAINYFGYEKSAKLSWLVLAGGLFLIMLQHWSHGGPPIPPLNHPVSVFLRDALLLFFLICLAGEPKTLEHFPMRRLTHVHIIIGFLSFIFLWEKDLYRLTGLFFFLIYMLFLTDRGILRIWTLLVVYCLAMLYVTGTQIRHHPTFVGLLMQGIDPLYDIFRLISLGIGGWGGSETAIQITKEFLPHDNPNLIFSIIGAYKGFLGTGAIVLFYLVLIFCCTRMSLKLKKTEPMVLSAGMTFYLFFQTITQIGWASHLIPFEGMGLPFIDHRPSIILVIIALGVLISCSKEKGQGFFREQHTLALVKKRVSVAFVIIAIAFSLLLVRLFQYQVLNKDWHMNNFKGISDSFGLSRLILKD